MNNLLVMRISNTVYELCQEYESKMLAEGAWSGHAYAPEYFADFRERVSQLCLEVKTSNIAEKAKVKASAVLLYLRTDYDTLIHKCYDADWDRNEVRVIAEALSDAFKVKLKQAMGELAGLFKILSGRSIDEKKEEENFVSSIVREISPDFEKDFEPVDTEGYTLEGTCEYDGKEYFVHVSFYDGESSWERSVAKAIYEQISPQEEVTVEEGELCRI